MGSRDRRIPRSSQARGLLYLKQGGRQGLTPGAVLWLAQSPQFSGNYHYFHFIYEKVGTSVRGWRYTHISDSLTEKIHLPALPPHSLSDLKGCLDSTNKSPLPGYSSPSYLILLNPKHSPKLIWLRLEADPSVKSSIFAFMFSPMWVVKIQHFSLMFQEPQKIKRAASSQPTTEFTVYSAAHNTSASILSGSSKRYKLGPYNYPL